MRNFNAAYKLVILLSLLHELSGCRKLVEIDPPVDRITPDFIYSTDESAASVLTGIYNDMTFEGHIATGNASIGFMLGLSADEIDLKSSEMNSERIDVYKNNLQSISSTPLNIWSTLYAIIYRVNSAMAGINASSQISDIGRKQLLAEAKFLRAFAYFYLVNIFGDVPLVLTSDVLSNSNIARTSTEDVYKAILLDLESARDNMNDVYLMGNLRTPTNERVRPNKLVAQALLSRVYLYLERWSDAEREASDVILNSQMKLELPSDVFKKNSTEAIWQLQRTSLQQHIDAELYIPIAGGLEKTQYLNNSIYSAFDSHDERRRIWISSGGDTVGLFHYPSKYSNTNLSDISGITEYVVVFRLGELYLIRAEARAKMGNILGNNSAKSDLDLIRTRAGLSGWTGSTQSEILNAIMDERRLELFTEWGHRWLDLKRTNRLNNVMAQAALKKGSGWESFKALYPIPLSDLQTSPALSGHQNPGYD